MTMFDSQSKAALSQNIKMIYIDVNLCTVLIFPYNMFFLLWHGEVDLLALQYKNAVRIYHPLAPMSSLLLLLLCKAFESCFGCVWIYIARLRARVLDRGPTSSAEREEADSSWHDGFIFLGLMDGFVPSSFFAGWRQKSRCQFAALRMLWHCVCAG